MRLVILLALLESAALGAAGCDNPTPTPASSDPVAREAALPGVPKDGPEAPKAKK